MTTLESDSSNIVQKWWTNNTSFLDKWAVTWIVFAMILLFALVNQLYLSIGSESFKQRRMYEWIQLSFLICIPALASFLVWHQATLQPSVQMVTTHTPNFFRSSVPSLILVILLAIGAIVLQTYVIYGKEKFHRRRMLELLLLVIVFLLVSASFMAVQPIF